MEEKKRYSFGIRKQLVLLTTVLALVTFTTSGIFIYLIYPFIKQYVLIGEVLFTLITLGLGIVWSGILTYFAARLITKPLQDLEAVALKAANGDISEDVELTKADNEIRSLGMAFNTMLLNLRKMVKTIDENFNETNQKVVAISNESAAALEHASSIAQTIDEISQGAQSSAAATQMTTESVEGVIQFAESVGVKAKNSEKLSNELVHSLENSRQVVQSLISGIEAMEKNNSVSLESVKHLEKATSQVEDIIRFVGDIASQTNLLALNASIEAARAGEHGKGFSVVAEEVRLLADECAKSVQGISDLIKTIQQDVQTVVAQMKEQVRIANLEASKGVETNTAIDDMTHSVANMASATTEIVQLVQQQMAEIQHLSKQSEEVAAIAEETSAGAYEVTNATHQQKAVMNIIDGLANELMGQAEKLKSTITQFKR